MQEGIEYDILDMNLGHNTADLIKRIRDFRPDLVGMSLISQQYRKFYQLLSEVKRRYPQVKTVVGGAHVTILKEQVLRDCPAIDYGVVHEGEGLLIELCRGVPEEKIKGLVFRCDDDIIYKGARPWLTNLDDLPWPQYHKFELDRYISTMTIYTSRGCPYECIFCPNRIVSPQFRARSSGNVVDEIEYWYARGKRQFNFDDDNFNQIRSRVFEICDEIERRGLKDLFIHCSNGIRADRVDREMLTRMWEVGFRSVAFGVDGGNNRILEILKKGETIEAIEEGIKTACEIGYDVKLLFVIGTPYETWDDVEDKVRLTRRYPVHDVHFYNTIPYPGTELYDWVRENNCFLKKPEEYLNEVSVLVNEPVFETPELPAAKRRDLHRYLDRVNTQVHRNALRRKIKGPRWIGVLASYMLNDWLIEKLFHQNVLFHKMLDRFRYRLAMSKRPKGTGAKGSLKSLG
jgi:anaerobic magnesium-protoporphyrin IX monomethyl ester cyclase